MQRIVALTLALHMIGFLGGTFDPIHYGHLRPAQEAARRLGLTRVCLIPAAHPPHREPPLASAAHRLRMAQLAAAEFPSFIVDDRELRRDGPSYTVLTLESLRAELGEEPLALLVGVDAFLTLPSWYRWMEIFALAHIVVMSRSGVSADPAQWPSWATTRLESDVARLTHRPAGAIVALTVTPESVSASALRAKIAHGETPSAAELPPRVWEYITQHNLYRSHPH